MHKCSASIRLVLKHLFCSGLAFLVIVSHGDGSGSYSMGNVLYSMLQNPAIANRNNQLTCSLIRSPSPQEEL